MSLYVALLFVLLTPGVLLRLPPKGSLLTVAIVHGLVFALVYHCTHKMVWRLTSEGFTADPPMMATCVNKQCSNGGKACMKNSDC